MTKILTFIAILFISATLTKNSAQTLYFSAATGNWSTPSTWSTVSFAPLPFAPFFAVVTAPATTSPGAGDFVSIVTGHTVTANSNITASTVSITSGGAMARLIVSASFTATFDTLTMTPSGAGTSQIENNGTLNTFKLKLTTSNSASNSRYINNGTHTTSLTEFEETTGNNSITLNGGSLYSTTDVNVSNTSPANTIIDMSSGNGVFRLINGGFNGNQMTFTGGNSGSRIEYRGNTAQTITSSNPNFVFNEIRVINTVGASLDAPLTLTNITGDLRTAGSGIINQAGFDITLPGRILITANGVFNGNANITTGTDIRNDGSFNQATGSIITGTLLDNRGIYNQTSGTVVTGANLDNRGTYNQTSGLITIGNDLINRSIFNANDNIDITRHFNNQSGASFISTGSNINVERNWINNGTYTYAVGDIVSLDGTGGNSAFVGTTEFYELNVTKAGNNAVAGNGDVITIRSILDVDAGNFRVTGTGSVTLLSDASGTAQLDELETGADFIGNLEVQRYLALGNNGWREVTSPISGSTLANWQDDGIVFTGFTGAPWNGSNWFGWINTYTYTEANAAGTKDNGWVAATNITNPTSFSNGHRIYMGTGTQTLSITGAPQKGLMSATISNAGNAADDQNGWNLIGNPYPCTIDWNTLATSSTEDAIWIWNATAGNYGVYVGGAGSGTNGVDNHIAHSQAFWVHGTGGSGSVIFQESNKVRNDKAFVKSSTNDEYVRIKLTGSVNSYYDEAILTFDDEATANFDAGIDRNKLFSTLDDVAPSLAITTADNADLSIAGVNQYKSSTIALKAYSGTTAYGAYTVEFNFPSTSLVNSCVTLEDLETGSITDLKTNNSYTFNVNANSPQERFLIHITNPFETTLFQPTCANLIDGAITIEGANVDGNTFTLSNSNVVLQTIVGNGNQLTFEDLTSGEYTITSSQNSSCGHNSVTAFITSPDELISSFEVENSIIYLDDNNTISPINNSNGNNYTWDFGDGNTSIDENPIHTYNEPGVYTITLTTEKDGCETIQFQTIEVRATTSVDEQENIVYSIITNNGNIVINTENTLNENIDISVTSMSGQNIYNSQTNSNTSVIDTKSFAKGIYLVTIKTKTSQFTDKVLIK